MIKHSKIVKNAILSLVVGLSILFGVVNCKNNQKLSEELKTANNNIEAYQELQSSQQASRVLYLNMAKLGETKDTILTKMNDVANDNNVKPKTMLTAATQTQDVNVKRSKKIEQDTILKDTTYSDTIKYNDLTTISYTIGKDTVSIGLKLNNTQYLYIYKDKHYRYKNFWKRLIRFCWKKDIDYKYKIINTNDLLKTSDVRVVNAK